MCNWTYSFSCLYAISCFQQPICWMERRTVRVGGVDGEVYVLLCEWWHSVGSCLGWLGHAEGGQWQVKWIANKTKWAVYLWNAPIKTKQPWNSLSCYHNGVMSTEQQIKLKLMFGSSLFMIFNILVKNKSPKYSGLISVGFFIGIPQVGISHTIPVPANTIPIMGMGTYCTIIRTVSDKTHSIPLTHGISIIKITIITIIIALLKYYTKNKRRGDMWDSGCSYSLSEKINK